jgi:hypothetical protein
MLSTTRFNFSLAGILCASIVMVALTGCSGSNQNASSNARIRGIDMCPNGGVATLFVNSGTLEGQISFEQVTPFLYLKGGLATFTFTLSATPTSAYGLISAPLNSGDDYSSIVIGRSDVPLVDPRHPQVIVSQDVQSAPPSGMASLRIIHAAPDQGNIDVALNGSVVATSVQYGVPTTYANVSAGSDTFSFYATGTKSTVAPSATYSLSAGKIYTVYLAEPTVSPKVAYSSFFTNDNV